MQKKILQYLNYNIISLVILFIIIQSYTIITKSYANEEKIESKSNLRSNSDLKSHSNSRSESFYNDAEILILNQNSGEKKHINVSKHKSTKFDNISISIIACWKETNNIYSPESKALIEIIDQNNQKIIFFGWIFSNHKNISQPYYKKYFFILNKCY